MGILQFMVFIAKYETHTAEKYAVVNTAGEL